MPKKLVALSASRLKVFKDCSWLYYCKYVLRLPDRANAGALRGTCCHTVFEALLKPRHRVLYDEVVKEPATIRNSPVINRYVKSYVKKYSLSDEDYTMIDSMIVVGLLYDFYCTKGGGEDLKAETQFDITNKSPEYRIAGFIDKTARYAGKALLRVVDYKSSKKKFDALDLEDNLQAQVYSVAAKKMHPDLTPVIEFIFLKFPEKPVQRLKFSDTHLAEFERYLADMSKQITGFTFKDATKNLAARKPMVADGFSGPKLCGFGKKEGQLKKNGEPMWACMYRYAFDYYAVCNAEDEVIRSSFNDDLIANESKGEYKIKKKYHGCPAWNKTGRVTA